MVVTHDLISLVETDRDDVFSVSLDIDPAKLEHQTVQPAYMIRLKNGIRDILEGLPKRRRKQAAHVAAQILAFVEMMRPEGRGLAIFAGPDLWRQQFFPFSLPNRISYGRPDVMPVLWTVDEYQPYAILVVDRERARILAAYLGAAAVMERDALVLDTSEWHFTAGRQPTYTKATGTGAARGAQRDTFEARIDDHLRRFWVGAAEAAVRWLDELHVDRLILAGPPEATAAVEDALPDRARVKLAATVPMAADADLAEIRERTLEAALQSERGREEELIAAVLDRTSRPAGSVTGIDATLAALQQGEAMTVIADRDLEGTVGRCRRCGYVTAKSRLRCEVCRGKLEQVSFPQVLPLLVRRSGARLELVGKESAGALRALGGLAAILRFRSHQVP
jgi:peptide chain release factor subunit 1